MQVTRLERSLFLLVQLNALRFKFATGQREPEQRDLLLVYEMALREHDAEARARGDARQLLIWDALIP